MLKHSVDPRVLKQLFRDSPMPIAIYDARGELLEANEAHEAFSTAIGERLGIGMGNALCDLRGEREGHRVQFLRALAGANVDYPITWQAGGTSGNGEVFEFHRALLPTFDADDSILAVTSVIIDVSEWLGAERDRARLQADLLQAQKSESLGLLAGGIAHDFNNLLVSVLGNASLVLEELSEDSNLRPMVDAIRLSAERAADVARQLLAYAGKGHFRVETVNLSELVRETVEVLRITLADKGELRLELASEPAHVKVDVTQLRQVVMNLTTNARDALEGGGRVTVRTGIAPAGDPRFEGCLGAPDPRAPEFAFVEVEDTGKGMGADTIERIFDPFYTTKASGTGLGLSAVLGIVRSHEGGLRVESTPGQGTRMCVLLPRQRSAGRQCLRRVAGDEARRQRVPRAGHVLVVDDQESVRKMLQRMLVKLGHRATVVSSGAAALDALAQDGADVYCVLLDLTMPGEDGAAVYSRIRARHPDLPVVFMSGYEASSVPDGEAFLPKPFRLDRLRSVLAELDRT